MTAMFLLELVLGKAPSDSSTNGPEKTVVLFRAKESASKTSCYSTSETTLAFLRATRCTFMTGTWLLAIRLLLALWVLFIRLLSISGSLTIGLFLAIRGLLLAIRLLLSVIGLWLSVCLLAVGLWLSLIVTLLRRIALVILILAISLVWRVSALVVLALWRVLAILMIIRSRHRDMGTKGLNGAIEKMAEKWSGRLD